MIALLAGLAAGCDFLDLPTPEPTATLRPTTTATPVPTATPAAVISDTGRITLTLWYPDQLSTTMDQPGGIVLASQYRAFEEMYPDVHITGSRFRGRGPGGLLDYLLTTSKVLPEDLPDLMLLNVHELAEAASLLQPLEAFGESEAWGDLFPLARQISQVEGRALAVPYELDARLLVYDADVVSDVLDLSVVPVPYLLPLGGAEAAAEALLLQVLSQGGVSADEQGQLVLDECALAAALEFYRARYEQGQLHAAVLTTTHLVECWQMFDAGEADLAEATAHLVLADPGERAALGCATIPTVGGAAVAMVDGWAWVIVAQDSYRQQAAWALLSWLMEEENLGARCAASSYLPPRQGALTAAFGESPCLPTLERLLNLSPAGLEPLDSEAVALLHAALQEVLLGNQSSAEAAAEVAAALAAAPR